MSVSPLVIKIRNRSFQKISHEERDAVKMLVTQRTNTIEEEDADDDEHVRFSA